jgi:hypothetical protein
VPRGNRLAAAVGLLVSLAPPLAAGERPAQPPVAAFAALEGRWRGTFVGWDPSGVELYRIDVTQTFTTVDAHTQAVAIEDRMADGTVVRTTGVHRARRNARGEIELTCDLTRSNGDRVHLRARPVRGPLGTAELVWHGASGDRSETFREAVVHDGSSILYTIDGMGRYGDKLVLMAGRYRKVDG